MRSCICDIRERRYMKKHYDVGMVGCWYWGNYGSLLNGYAIDQILKSFGLSTLKIVTPYNGFEPHAKKFFEVVYDKEDISPALPFEELHSYNSCCDIFLTGSDQIWNYNPNKADRRYDKYFRLDFVDNDKKKISFATSLGRYVREKEGDYQEFQRLYSRYNAISVREQQGVEVFKKEYGIDVTRVLEPVLAVEPECWYKIAAYSEYFEKEPYMLTYILDPTPEKRKAIEFYGNKLGIKIINILDGFSGTYLKNKQALNLENTLPNIWCADFLKYYSNAQFVITDSFHGTCFALIFNKPFITVGNVDRGNQRFENLLNMVGMKKRMISDSNNITLDEKFLYHMDFRDANRILDIERKKAVEWLKNAIFHVDTEEKVHMKRHINISLSQEECVGCGACLSVCNKEAIQLRPDKYGVYRTEVDENECINCGLCKQVCPALNLPKNLNSSKPIAYAFINSDKKTLMESSSGGAFTALAKTILKRGGIVFGAAWKDDFTVEHIMVDSEDKLYMLQKSKYFQSYLGTTFRRVKEYAERGLPILFSGTPCQVAGLKKYLRRNYTNLILVDLLCANCPSSAFFKQYLNENFNISKIEKYDFRYKKEDIRVWNAKSVKLTKKNGSTEILEHEKDDYLQVYHTCSLALASQCLTCKYQGNTRVGDLTIGDCWGIEHYDESIDCSKGVSVILVNNEKGEDFLSIIPKEYIGVLKEEPLDSIKKYNILAFQEKRNWPRTLRREKFHEEILKGSFSRAKEEAEKLKK